MRMKIQINGTHDVATMTMVGEPDHTFLRIHTENGDNDLIFFPTEREMVTAGKIAEICKRLFRDDADEAGEASIVEQAIKLILKAI